MPRALRDSVLRPVAHGLRLPRPGRHARQLLSDILVVPALIAFVVMSALLVSWVVDALFSAARSIDL